MREQEQKQKAEATRRNEKLRQRRHEQKQQTAVHHASEQGVNPAAFVFDPADGTAAAAAATARAQLAAKKEAAARDELQSVRVRGELWARNTSGHLVFAGGGGRGGRGERSSAGATEPEGATGGNYAEDADLAQYAYVRASP